MALDLTDPRAAALVHEMADRASSAILELDALQLAATLTRGRAFSRTLHPERRRVGTGARRLRNFEPGSFRRESRNVDPCASGSRPHHSTRLGRHARRLARGRRHRALRVGWNFDHFYPIFSDPTGPCLEGWTMLAALARPPSGSASGRSPGCPTATRPCSRTWPRRSTSSRAAARLGLGAGWYEAEATVRHRRSRPEGALRPVRRARRGDRSLLISQETSDHDGRHVQLRDRAIGPKPVQRPHPPIMIGGNGPTRTLRTVEQRFAQQWNSTAEHRPLARRQRPRWPSGVPRTGRDPSSIERSVNLQFDASQPVGCPQADQSGRPSPPRAPTSAS